MYMYNRIMEEWKAIDEAHDISNLGNIRNSKSKIVLKG